MATFDELAKAVRTSHTITRRVELRNPSGEVIRDLYADTASVGMDETSRIRNTCRADVIFKEFTSNEKSLIDPIQKNELWIYRGVEGIGEVKLGQFKIRSYSISDSKNNYRIQLRGADYSRTIRRNRFLTNYHVDPGVRYPEAIKTMLQFMNPEFSYDFTDTDDINVVTPKLDFGGSGGTGGSNAWESAEEMAESIACEIFFNREGVCILRPVPETQDLSPVENYHEGRYAKFLNVATDRTDEDTYNVVVVRGESTSNDEPVMATAEDDDEQSDTWVGGPYGRVPHFEQSNYVTTETQAQQLADAMLRRRMAVTENVRISSIVNPALEVGQVVSIKRAKSQIDNEYVIERMTMPLDYNTPLEITMRTRRG